MSLRLVLPALCGLLSSPLLAQNLVVHDLILGTFVESVGVSPLFPGAGAAVNMYAQGIVLPPVRPGALMMGGCTIDGTNGMTWYSNGLLIANVPHNAYPAGVPAVPAPFPPHPALPGPVTGMALDPIGGILWLTDGLVVLGMAPLPGGALMAPPFVPFFGFPLPPLMGLEWDGLTGTLWATDIFGVAYNFVPGGAPAGPPMPPPMPFPGPVTGITIDKTSLAMPGAPRSVYVTGGGMIQDLSTGAVFPTFGTGLEVGMTFHPAPSFMPPGGPCACPNFAMGHALRGPMTTGNPNFGVDLVGLPPFAPVGFVFDVGFNPAFPLVNGVGCALGLNLLSPTLILIPGVANGAGVAALPISLVGVPPGASIYMQYVTLCPADPAGFVLTPLYQVMVSSG